MWGHVKTLVYTGRTIETRDMLKEIIIWAFDQIKKNIQLLSRVGEQLCFRCHMCIECGGNYFERYVRDTHLHPRT